MAAPWTEYPYASANPYRAPPDPPDAEWEQGPYPITYDGHQGMPQPHIPRPTVPGFPSPGPGGFIEPITPVAPPDANSYAYYASPPFRRSSLPYYESDPPYPTAGVPQPNNGDYFSFPEPQIPYAHSAPPAPPPARRRPSVDQPPLPPKPRAHAAHRHSSTHVDSSDSDVPSRLPTPSSEKPPLPPKPPEVDPELQRALDLSLHSERQRRETQAKEDAELARALRESLYTAETPLVIRTHASSHELPAHSDYSPESIVASPVQSSTPLPISSPPPSSYHARKLSPSHSHSHLHSHSHSHSRASPHSASVAQNLVPSTSGEWPAPDAGHAHLMHPTIPELELPEEPAEERARHRHRDSIAHSNSSHAHPHLSMPVPQSAPPSATSLAPPAMPHMAHSVPDAKHAHAAATHMLRSVSADPSIPSRSQSMASDASSSSSTSRHRHPRHQSSRKDSSSLNDKAPPVPAKDLEVPDPCGALGVHQHIPQELLRGVSMGFGAAPITSSREPMHGTIPTVISLPWEEQKPFYIQGPDWRSLLKLMARLSSTQVEPSVEAIRKTKGEMRLRVVVSFVRVHSSSSHWRTVFYMTIDRPVPLNASNSSRYRSGDTTVLPYSYTLTPPPPLLQDGADAPMSKYYTIPSIPGNLYPTLPVTFPDLATYLASALEASRDAVHESPGLRRLAKLIDTLYPANHPNGPAEEEDEKMGMRQKLKNLVGFGQKVSRNRNEETYDLVTPFIADEFGR
ncbi:uncharacterized protein LAESUDRAFT_753629 [Laetiporus sulphureus 93-53]|uniref:Uncharacterized protein n=1 Tax=Laetiporus sulphureus 93-53 TaxID=1314785 RepID=A0A165I3S6_9APHY|nr:uncharacterized protein LAESUDRAFT_753629 [Laetiporus sulphureus 93-53]KZT12557.1 hypothetical protein LAESUDRAFT_753629 [Laetiporus sulphureus 93-53]